MQDNSGITKDERVAVLTTNPKAIYNNYTLLKNENVLEAIESFEKYKFNGSNPATSYVRARIKNLYRHLRQDLKKNLDPKDFDIAEQKITTATYDDLMYLYEEIICEFMAEIGLISTANKRDYDTQDAIAEDDAKGM